MQTSRRTFLAIAGTAPLAMLAGKGAAADPVCYNPATLPLAQKTLRTSLEFQEVSPDPKKRCGLCVFFTASKGSCGACQIMSGAPVTTQGVCSSFAPKG